MFVLATIKDTVKVGCYVLAPCVHAAARCCPVQSQCLQQYSSIHLHARCLSRARTPEVAADRSCLHAWKRSSVGISVKHGEKLPKFRSMGHVVGSSYLPLLLHNLPPVVGTCRVEIGTTCAAVTSCSVRRCVLFICTKSYTTTRFERLGTSPLWCCQLLETTVLLVSYDHSSSSVAYLMIILTAEAEAPLPSNIEFT